MNSRQFQFNRRSVVSLVLAALALIVTVTPALAWEDEGDQRFQPIRACQLALDQGAGLAGPCPKAALRHVVRRAVEGSPAHPAVAREEALFLESQPQWTQLTSR